MKRRLSQTISNLLHRKLHFGSRKQWYIGIALVVALSFAFAAFTPGIETAKWHLEHPNTVSCQSFTAHIPPLWTANRTNPLEACLYGFTISKSSSAFGTLPHRFPFVIISPMPHPASFHSWAFRLRLLHRLYPGATPVPYRLNSTFTNCYLTPYNMRAHSVEFHLIDVYCVDQKRKLTLDYTGPRSALPQVARMIH